jgi:hypothetical protein
LKKEISYPLNNKCKKIKKEITIDCPQITQIYTDYYYGLKKQVEKTKIGYIPVYRKGFYLAPNVSKNSIC